MDSEDLERKIREEERFLERGRGLLEVEDNPVRLEELGQSALTKGLCCLLLDRCGEARTSFLTAHDYFLRRVDAEESFPWVPVVLRNALYSAVLADDWGTAESTAERILGLSMDSVGQDVGAEESLHYARVVAGVVAEEEEVMMGSASWLLDNAEGDGREVYRGVAGYALGVLNDDVGMVLGGIDRVLHAHSDGVPMEGRSFDEAVCLPATALAAIAWRRGYDFEVDNEFVPLTRGSIP